MGDLLDWVCADDDHDDVGAIVPAQVPAPPHAEHALARVEDRDCFEAPRIRGKCGKGRHGSDKDRAMLTYHMRSVKQARKKSQGPECSGVKIEWLDIQERWEVVSDRCQKQIEECPWHHSLHFTREETREPFR